MAQVIFAIGALGGSGTRAVAELLIQAGLPLGEMLNVANDEILFTKLFKNPAWYRTATPSAIDQRIRLYIKYRRGEILNALDISTFFKAMLTNRTSRSHPSVYFHLLRHALPHTPRVSSSFGWKEPNTALFLEHFARNIDSFTYIHVIRHGLDMAFSNNRNQLRCWGDQFGIKYTGDESKEELYYKQLEYWIRATRATITRGRSVLGERFLLVNHTMLSEQPELEVGRILHHLHIVPDPATVQQLNAIPKITNSMYRYRDRDISIFTQEQLHAVEELGFSIQ